MAKRKLPEPIRLRKKMCLEIAETIQDHLSTNQFDVDEVARIVAISLPLTYAEAEAERIATRRAEERRAKKYPPKGPSAMSRLRTSLGLKEDVDMLQVIEAAIEAVEFRKKVRAL